MIPLSAAGSGKGPYPNRKGTSISNLPDAIIDACLKRLDCVEDFVRCGSVCKSWRSIVAAIRQENKYHKNFAPWLMLTPPDDEKEGPQNFFSFASDKMISMNLGPLSRGKRCWGSSYGWILTIGLDLNIHLFNPLTQTRLSLPSQTTFDDPFRERRYEDHPSSLYPRLPRCFLDKLILSSDPYCSSLPVMAIHGCLGDLAIARPGDQSWTSVSKPGTSGCLDAIFFKGHFYVVTRQGHLLICDIDSPYPSATRYASPPDGCEGEGINHFYLVEMSGDLHLIARRYAVICTPESLHYNTDGFLVHKLDFHTKAWIMLEDIGDHVLFLGNNNSFAISSTKYPQFKRNSIYFCHDHGELLSSLPYDDMGIYDYADEVTVETKLHVGNDVPTDYNRPFFFVPSF